MREISSEKIFFEVKNLIRKASFFLPKEILKKISDFKKKEKKTSTKKFLEILEENAEIARKKEIPICQDTGTAVFFVEIGHEVFCKKPISEILENATRESYRENFLRNSICNDPVFDRKNTRNNLPAVFHLEQVRGKKLKISFLAKGGGAENKSILQMLSPDNAEKKIITLITEAAKNAGAAACPPFLVGIGIGGNFDTVSVLAKKAILRSVNSKNANSKFAKLEEKIFTEIKKLKIGPGGLGGENFLLGVNIEFLPCHIASLPVAVNFQCHAARFYSVEI